MFYYKVKILLLLVWVGFSCTTVKQRTEKEKIMSSKESQEALIEKYLTNGAKKYSYYSNEYEAELDKGLAEDSTIAVFWQKKAMHRFKEDRYELGKIYIDKAVKYDPEKYQDYRAFISCIFGRRYREAIRDFEDYKKTYGNSYVMDHTYDFYIALSYLQLEEFEKAEQIFTEDIRKLKEEKGEDWVHHLDLFYLGVTKYELGKYPEAIQCFDRALAKYSTFSEVQYYKALSLRYLYGEEREEDVKDLFFEARTNRKQGYTINEDNVVYTRYPYQLRK